MLNKNFDEVFSREKLSEQHDEFKEFIFSKIEEAKSFFNENNLKSLNIIECFDRKKGEIGYFIWDKISNKELFLSSKLYELTDIIDYEDLEEFKNIYNECLSENYYMLYHDDAKTLKVGFDIFTKDGVVWHRINIRNFKI